MKRWHLLFGITLAGTALRLSGLRVGLWRDEGATYYDSLPSTLDALIGAVAYSELNPPGFFVVMHHWMQVFGASEIVFKLPAFLFGLLLIPAAYALGAVAGSARAGLVAAAIAAFAPQAIYYSQEARPYTLTALLSCLVVLCFLHALGRRPRIWWFLAFVACAVLLLYVHYTGLLLIASLAAVCVILRWRRKADVPLVPFGAAFALIFLLFLPWLPVFLTHLQTGTPWATEAGWWTKPGVFLSNLTEAAPLTGAVSERLRSTTSLLMVAALATAVWMFRGTGRLKRLWSEPGNLAGVALALTFVIVALMLGALSYGRRYMFPFLPIGWVIAGQLLVAMVHYLRSPAASARAAWAGQAVLVVGAAGLMLASAQYALALSNLQKSGIRSLAVDVHGTPGEKTFYLLSPDMFGSTFGYYTARVPVEFHGFARWTRPEVFTPRGYKELWDDPNLVAGVERQIRAKADDGYRRLGLVQQTGTIGDAGQLRLSRANQLLSRLKDTYPLVQTRHYPGWLESVTLYVFELRGSESADAADPLSAPQR